MWTSVTRWFMWRGRLAMIDLVHVERQIDMQYSRNLNQCLLIRYSGKIIKIVVRFIVVHPFLEYKRLWVLSVDVVGYAWILFTPMEVERYPSTIRNVSPIYQLPSGNQTLRNVTFPPNGRYSIVRLHYRRETKTEILISRWCGEEEEPCSLHGFASKK